MTLNSFGERGRHIPGSPGPAALSGFAPLWLTRTALRHEMRKHARVAVDLKLELARTRPEPANGDRE